jgi:hypothetical protein
LPGWRFLEPSRESTKRRHRLQRFAGRTGLRGAIARARLPGVGRSSPARTGSVKRHLVQGEIDRHHARFVTVRLYGAGPGNLAEQ